MIGDNPGRTVPVGAGDRLATQSTAGGLSTRANASPADGSSLLAIPPAVLRQLEGLSVRSRRRQAYLGQGDRRSPMRGNSLQLVDYRPYVPGDDLRQVDWNVYSRSGELFVRLYEDERTLTVHVLVDISRSMDWGIP